MRMKLVVLTLATATMALSIGSCLRQFLAISGTSFF